MTRLSIDGQAYTGNYRVDCECGQTWNGQAEGVPNSGWSPALPIAECIAHMQMAHDGSQVDLRFSQRFNKWLMIYWDQAGVRLAGRERARVIEGIESKR